MAKMILLCGKICSGKTTYAKRLAVAKKAVLLSVDEITLALFGQHIGEKHDEMVEKTEIYLFKKAVEIVAAGIDVIFDWGFWTNEERQYATQYYMDKKIPIEWHYIDVCDDVWRQNLNKRNERIINGQDNFYFIDDNVATKFKRLFEIPKRYEMDVWYENCCDEQYIEPVLQGGIKNNAMSISIRPAQMSDFPIIEALLSQITQVHYAVRPDLFRQFHKKAETDSIIDLQDADAPVFVATSENNCIVGCLWCIVKRERNNSLKVDRDWLVIDDICVDEKYRGNGIGRKLVDFAYRFAKEKGLDKVELNVYTDNRDAVRFYKRLGFKTQKCVMELNVPVSLLPDQETDKERQARIYPIILSEYNPAWAEWFVQERMNLERLIGIENIVQISHFGSTSVPGLAAKPTVDILLEIRKEANVSKLIDALSLPEYICLNPPDMPTPPPHLVFLKGYTPTGFADKVYHIHVRYPGDWDELYFRDYLIAHPETVSKYAALKTKLHKDFEHDRDGYTKAKTAFIREVTEKARKL